MEQLTTFLENKFLIKKNITKDDNQDKLKSPKIGAKAYDYNDNEWIIDAYSSIDNKIHKDCSGIEDLLKTYDTGSMREELSYWNDSTIIIGAKRGIGEYSAFPWDKDGLYYKED